MATQTLHEAREAQKSHELHTSHESHMEKRTLRNILRADAVFCISTGLLCTLGAAPVSEFMGIADKTIIAGINGLALLFIIGLVTAVYGLWLGAMTFRPQFDMRVAWVALALDVEWVVMSALILLTGALSLTTGGSWAVLIVADCVLLFGIAKVWAMRR